MGEAYTIDDETNAANAPSPADVPSPPVYLRDEDYRTRSLAALRTDILATGTRTNLDDADRYGGKLAAATAIAAVAHAIAGVPGIVTDAWFKTLVVLAVLLPTATLFLAAGLRLLRGRRGQPLTVGSVLTGWLLLTGVAILAGLEDPNTGLVATFVPTLLPLAAWAPVVAGSDRVPDPASDPGLPTWVLAAAQMLPEETDPRIEVMVKRLLEEAHIMHLTVFTRSPSRAPSWQGIDARFAQSWNRLLWRIRGVNNMLIELSDEGKERAALATEALDRLEIRDEAFREALAAAESRATEDRPDEMRLLKQRIEDLLHTAETARRRL